MSVSEQPKKQRKRHDISAYQFKPGQSGNPGGRPKKLPITEALQEILADPEKARAYVLAALKHAIKSGSASHFKEINDRVEGRVVERVEHTGANGSPLTVRIEFEQPDADSNSEVS